MRALPGTALWLLWKVRSGCLPMSLQWNKIPNSQINYKNSNTQTYLCISYKPWKWWLENRSQSIKLTVMPSPQTHGLSQLPLLPASTWLTSSPCSWLVSSQYLQSCTFFSPQSKYWVVLSTHMLLYFWHGTQHRPGQKYTWICIHYIK